MIVWDDAEPPREEARAAGFEVAELRGIDWSEVASLVLTPGVPLTHPEPHWSAKRATAAGVEIIGDIELFCRERAALAPEAPLIAITGTNGKSTTTALTAHLFGSAGWDVQMGGNIGTAVLALDPPKTRPAACSRGLVLPDRPRAEPRPNDRHVAEPQPRPHRSARHHGALRCRQGTADRTLRMGPWSASTTR